MENNEDTILLVDDDPDILEFLGYNLRKNGFRVYTSTNGTEAIERAREVLPQLIILDVMMPGMDGIETCAEIRKMGELRNTLIAFLSARGEDYSQIAGFEAGADDYIRKPVKPNVLVHRVKALLRRFASQEDDRLIRLNNLVIDRDKYIIIHNKKEISLPKKEFELLSFLATHPRKVFSREEIFLEVWGDDVVVGDRTIDVHIRRIREKIGMNVIKTIKGVGYSFLL
ncbi:MAG: response regulator transcription factor [Bacteroidales bacterium]|nr:response regulator transcription factor [Bacteroidales bacterium]